MKMFCIFLIVLLVIVIFFEGLVVVCMVEMMCSVIFVMEMLVFVNSLDEICVMSMLSGDKLLKLMVLCKMGDVCKIC